MEATKTSSYLEKLDCHFNWEMEPKMIQLERDFEPSTLSLGLSFYNETSPSHACRRFVACVFSASAAYMVGNHLTSVGQKLLDNAFRILAFSKDPSSLPPALKLPESDNPIWEAATMEEFYVACEKLESDDEDSSKAGDNSTSGDSEDEEVETSQEPFDGSFPMWNHDRFNGMYAGAENVAYSLKAMMAAKDGSLSDANSMLGHIKRADELTNSDRAFIYYVRGSTWELLTTGVHHFGDKQNALEFFAAAVQSDPTEIKWLIMMLECLSKMRISRHYFWGRKVEWSDIERIVKVVDSVVCLKIERWIEIDLLFEKLQAIKDYMVGHSREIPIAESQALYAQCKELCEHIVENTIDGGFLAYCAQFMSSSPPLRELAMTTIEKALKLVDKDTSAYINAKAANVYRRAKNLEKALECAEVAAKDTIGSSFQVLEIKVELGHEFDANSFFKELLTRFGRTKLFAEQIHCSAFLYYACIADDMVQAVRHFGRVMVLSTVSPRNILSDLFCRWIRDDVNIAEAGYNVALYVLNDFPDDSVSEGAKKVCMNIVEDIGNDAEKKNGFKCKRLTPREYVDYLKGDLRLSRRSNKPRGGGGNFQRSSKWEHRDYVKAQPKSGGFSSWRDEMRPPSEISDDLVRLEVEPKSNGALSQFGRSTSAQDDQAREASSQWGRWAGESSRQKAYQANSGQGSAQPWRSSRSFGTSPDENGTSPSRFGSYQRPGNDAQLRQPSGWQSNQRRPPSVSTSSPLLNDSKLSYNWRERKN